VAKLVTQKFMMTWFYKMANSVVGKQGKPLEHHHLIANPKTWATWTHSYGNKLGRLAQGMPGRAKGTDTISCYPQGQGTKDKGKRCHVGPHHMLNQA
jgi:hypothetical protein